MNGAKSATKPEFDEELWGKKYQTVKRKCREYEEINDVLFTRAKRIRQMIEKAESERRFLARRLEQFQLLDLPRCRRPNNHHRSDDIEADNRLENGQCESSKVAVNGHDQSSTSSPRETKLSNAKTTNSAPSVVITHSSNPVSVPMATLTTPSAPSAPAAKSKRAPKGSSGGAEKKEKKPKKEGKAGSKRRKGDADPNAPKKPSNAFFWFCQEHRHALQEQIRGNAFGQHDLTKALARLWGETGPAERKKFYELYATDKKRYDREMSEYAMKLQQQKALAASAAPTEPLLDTSLDASDDSMMM